VHKHLRLPPFTRLREFMQGNDITPASVYATGIISRRRLLDLLNDTGQPALRTAIALARHFAAVLHRPVWIGELFDIGDEAAIRQAITAKFPFFEVLDYETGQPTSLSGMCAQCDPSDRRSPAKPSRHASSSRTATRWTPPTT
jgi:hypothetical protein